MWSKIKRWGRGFSDAASQRLALYYVIGLVAFLVLVVLDWPDDRSKWADTFAVSAMIAAISAGVLQGGAFLLIGAVKIYNERFRNEGRIEGRIEERRELLDSLQQKNLITPEERQELEAERKEKSKS